MLNNGTIIRTWNKVAEIWTDGGAKYVPKRLWKEQIRKKPEGKDEHIPAIPPKVETNG